MISVEEARNAIAARVSRLEPVEVALEKALGFVLAEPVSSDAFYPSTDRSMMDGYVIGADEEAGKFRVTGEISAGQMPEQTLGKGEAIRIFTGAVIPSGGGRVVMQEDVRREGDFIFIESFSENRFIRHQGSEAKPGDVLLEKGTRLGAAELAILAQVGMTKPKVICRPIVRHLATGDELIAPDQVPGPSQIRETNSSLLGGLLRGLGVEMAGSTRAADDPAAIARVADGEWDLLLISGGASVGDYDFGAEALRRLGFEIHFDRVNLRPGKPLTFATRGRQAAFVIPGNPVSHFICFHVAIRLAIEILCGLPPNWNFLNLEIRNGVPLKPDPRDTFWPANVFVNESGKLAVSPKPWSSSGNTFSLAGTHALARVNATSPADGLVKTLLLDALPAAP